MVSTPMVYGYAIGVFNSEDISGECWGEGALGDGLVHANNLLRTTLMIYKPLEVAVP